jgi:hypothetical protein
MTKFKKQKKRTWKAFSNYIRTRDCIEYLKKHPELNELQCKCVTCDSVLKLRDGQAGHFIQGRNNALLFDERGVHFQCMPCNMYKGGRIEDYYPFMLDKYGQEVIDDLKSLRYATVKYTIQELMAMEKEYKELTEQLLSM